MPSRSKVPHSLSDFKRRSSELVERMRKSGQPMILTVHGKPELVVQTTKEYQRQIEDMEKMQTIEGIRRGLESMKAGSGRTAGDVFAELEDKYTFLRRK